MTGPTVNRLPTVDEILAGDTQAGIPRPSISIDDLPRTSIVGAPRSFWSRLRDWFRKVI